MRTPPFVAAMVALAADAHARPTAAMCSESLWWRCHRRLIADHAVLLEELPVRHILTDGRTAEHRLTDGVRRCDGTLIYDGSVLRDRDSGLQLHHFRSRGS